MALEPQLLSLSPPWEHEHGQESLPKQTKTSQIIHVSVYRCTCKCAPHCTGLAKTFIKLAVIDGIKITFSQQLLSTCKATCISEFFAMIVTKLRTRVVLALGFVRLNTCALACMCVDVFMPDGSGTVRQLKLWPFKRLMPG